MSETPSDKLFSAIELAPVEASSVDALLDHMVDFNAHEAIPWSREAGAVALQTLLADASIGLVRWVRCEGVRCGYCVLTWGFDLEWNGREAWLTELYLLPDARGRGLGLGVVRAIEALAIEHGARALHLQVRLENTRALALYRRAGFEDPGRRVLTRKL